MLRMLVEATLDFPEEEIDFLRKADAHGQLSKLQQSVQTVQQRARQGALLREGIKVVIAGQPNAGKSSLLNALAGAELAIVTPIAGTTRDKVQQTIQIEGVPLHVIDTAGLRDSDDEVEKIGIAHAWDAIAGADAVLFLHDLTRMNATDYIADDALIAGALAQKLPSSVTIIDLWNKADVSVVAPADAAAVDALRKDTRRPCPPRPVLVWMLCDGACWRWRAGSRCLKGSIWHERGMFRLCAVWLTIWHRRTLTWLPMRSTLICWPKNSGWHKMP